jgi:hypothetical protein
MVLTGSCFLRGRSLLLRSNLGLPLREGIDVRETGMSADDLLE